MHMIGINIYSWVGASPYALEPWAWAALPWESASGMVGWAAVGGCNTNNWDCLCPQCGAVQAKVCNGSGHIRRVESCWFGIGEERQGNTKKL
jgi:hypothetical protein